MNESPCIDRVALVSAALLAALVLNGCSRSPHQTLAGGSYVGQVVTSRHVSPPPPHAAETSTELDDPTAVKKLEDAKARTNISDAKAAAKDAKAPAKLDNADAATTVDDAEAATTIDDAAAATTFDGAQIPAQMIHGKPILPITLQENHSR